MSDTIVVIAPPTSVPDGPYNAINMSLGNMLSGGATAAQIAAPYYANGGLTADCLKWLASYVEGHDLNDSNVQKIISGNIGTFCDADKKLANNPKMMVLSAFGSNKAFNYANEQIPKMSGNVTTPLAALGNFLWGNGVERSVDLNSVGLTLSPTKLPPVMEIVNTGLVGVFNIDQKFSYDTSQDSVIAASYLGWISLHTTGTLTIGDKGSWSYNGSVRAYNDIYDANASNHRGALGESMTTILRYLNGQAYSIAMPGEIPVSGSGSR